MSHPAIATWVNHPITQLFIKTSQEHKDSLKEAIDTLVMGQEAISPANVLILERLKGQIFTFDLILEIKDFFDEDDLIKLEKGE